MLNYLNFTNSFILWKTFSFKTIIFTVYSFLEVLLLTGTTFYTFYIQKSENFGCETLIILCWVLLAQVLLFYYFNKNSTVIMMMNLASSLYLQSNRHILVLFF